MADYLDYIETKGSVILLQEESFAAHSIVSSLNVTKRKSWREKVLFYCKETMEDDMKNPKRRKYICCKIFEGRLKYLKASQQLEFRKYIQRHI